MILPKLEEQYGGPLSFASNLRDGLNQSGNVEEREISSELDVLVVFVKTTFGNLLAAKRRGIPILLRLDGLYYRKKSGFFHPGFLRVNLKVFFIRKFIADFIVYQSDFCRDMSEALLGPSRKPYKIILNGVPPTGSGVKGSFEETGVNLEDAATAPQGVGGPCRFIAAGNFRNMDMLPLTVKALDLCQGEFPFELHVYGNVDELSKPWLKRPYVVHKGKIPNADMRKVMAGYDALLFTQLCPPCPNTVIEAVTAGLPVITFDSGSIRELLRFNHELIADTPKKLLHGLADFDASKLADCVRIFQRDRERFRSVSALGSSTFNDGRCFREYLDVMSATAHRRP